MQYAVTAATLLPGAVDVSRQRVSAQAFRMAARRRTTAVRRRCTMDQSSRPRRECTAGGTRCRKPPGAPSRCVGLDPGGISLHQCRHPLIAWLPVTAHFHKYAAGCTQVKASLLLPTSVAPQQVRAGCSFDVQVHASSTTTAEDAIPGDGLQICLLLPAVQDAERALVDCPHKVLRVQDGV